MLLLLSAAGVGTLARRGRPRTRRPVALGMGAGSKPAQQVDPVGGDRGGGLVAGHHRPWGGQLFRLCGARGHYYEVREGGGGHHGEQARRGGESPGDADVLGRWRGKLLEALAKDADPGEVEGGHGALEEDAAPETGLHEPDGSLRVEAGHWDAGETRPGAQVREEAVGQRQAEEGGGLERVGDEGGRVRATDQADRARPVAQQGDVALEAVERCRGCREAEGRQPFVEEGAGLRRGRGRCAQRRVRPARGLRTGNSRRPAWRRMYAVLKASTRSAPVSVICLTAFCRCLALSR